MTTHSDLGSRAHTLLVALVIRFPGLVLDTPESGADVVEYLSAQLARHPGLPTADDLTRLLEGRSP